MAKQKHLYTVVLAICLHQALSFVIPQPIICNELSRAFNAHDTIVNNNRLRGGSTTVDELKVEALRVIGAGLRRGGHGTARRKFQKVRKQSSKADEAKFQVNLILMHR